ncbi:MAG: TrmH family RNA methyltransferase [Rhodocyclaceae bacterium]
MVTLTRVKTLSSRDNPEIKRLHALAQSGRERRKLGLTLLDGPHLVGTAHAAGVHLHELVISDKGYANPEILALLAGIANVPVVRVGDGLFAHVSPVDTPSGILAVVDYPRLDGVPVPAGTILVLEAVQDPGNLGTILRTAAAAGVQQAYLTEGCAQAWSPRALRAGMGGHFSLEIVEGVDALALLECFAGPVLATSLDADAQPLYDIDLAQPVAWLFGAEGRGLSPALTARASQRLRIPMPGAVESLNVGAAVAICLFEQVRQGQTGRPRQ